MSYTLLVQGAAPIGYWKLNGSASAVVGSAASISTGSAQSWTTPPLTMNSASSLIVRPSGASVSIYNSYDAFYTNFESKVLAFEFWFSFNQLFDGSGWQKGLSSASQYYTNNKLNIVQIMNGATQIGSIYYDYNKNTIRFNINSGSIGGNTEAYFPIRNLNTSFYIVAGYDNQKLSLEVNGQSGFGGNVADTSLFPSRTSASVYFNINSNSLNSTPAVGSNFVIGELAIYNYMPNKDQQRRRVLYGTMSDKPTAITSVLETSFFDFYENSGQTFYYKEIEGEAFNNFFTSNNIKINKIEGLKAEVIPSLSISTQYPTASVTTTSSGVNFSGSISALEFDKFGFKFASEKFATITAQIKGVSSVPGVVMSLSNIIDSQISLFATAASGGFVISTYDPNSASTVSVLSLPVSMNASTTYNFGVSLTGGNIYLYGSGSTASVTVPYLAVTNSTQIALGNILDSPSANSMAISNFGMNNYVQTTFSGYDFTYSQASGAFYAQLVARLTKDLSISQFGTWLYNVPISNFGNSIIGSKVTWDGMDNCLVQGSSDNGATWSNMIRGQQIYNLTYGSPAQDQLLRVIVPFEYELEVQNQSFNNFNVALYRDISFLSADGNYTLIPINDTSGTHTYTIKRVQAPITLRQDNFGLHFDKFSGSVDGYAAISPTGSSTLTYGIDFWIRADSFPNTNNYILDGAAGSGQHPQLYTDNSGHFIYSTGTVYINGASIATNTYTSAIGEYYHIFYDFGGSFSPSSATMYLNGKYQGSASTHSHSTYGHLNIWSSSFSSASITAVNRYKNFVGTVIQSITDTTSTVWQSNWASDAITSASGYKIG